MIAPPGAGKGTHGAAIAEHFHVPHVAVGDLLRQEVASGTELGRAVAGYLRRGDLVPDDVVMGLLRRALTDAKAAGGGYVLDGVPRTMAQAVATYRIAASLGMTAEVALHLEADDDELVRRLLARAAVEHRADDTEPVIRRRLRLYHEVTHPVLRFYARRGILLTVDAMRPIEQVSRDIITALERRAAGRPPGAPDGA